MAIAVFAGTETGVEVALVVYIFSVTLRTGRWLFVYIDSKLQNQQKNGQRTEAKINRVSTSLYKMDFRSPRFYL